LASGNVIKAIPRIVWPTGNGAARRRWPGDGQEFREKELDPDPYGCQEVSQTIVL